jgi:hypothetical protein
MPKNKNIPIKYTSRDFNSIKKDLIEHAKRYYPDNYNDFSEASFGSLMFDTVSYVGDVLSYYLDYSVNESFLDTAVEFSNVRRHARNLGYKFSGIPVAFGTVSLFLEVPADINGNYPDLTFAPTLKKGAEFLGNNSTTYTLLEDIRFSDTSNDSIAVKFDPATNQTTHYAIRAFGQISSGKSFTTIVDLSNATFEKFRRVKVGDNTISEIIDIVDSEGNIFYEVDFLSQETVFIETTNPNALSDGVRSIMKPYVTARRFIVEQDDTGTYLQFGFGSDEDDDSGLADPSQVAIQMHAKNYVTNKAIDPTKILGTDKLGISPQGTVLTIIYRKNDGTITNAGSRSIKKVRFSEFVFEDEGTLISNSPQVVDRIKNSLEVVNDDPIVGSTVDFTIDELKVRSKNFFASQNRAVTKMDYEAIAYNMPTKFGQIKRINIINNPFATNKKLAAYVVSLGSGGNLTKTSMVTKRNLKSWINQYASINDVIEMFDAKIVNFSINFSIVTDSRFDTSAVLSNTITRLKNKYSEKFYIGEPLYINEIYNIINKTEGVVDAKEVFIENKNSTNHGGIYSSVELFMDDIISQDNTYYKAPKNVVFELRYPDENIKGTAV